jgi:multidrug efflux pump subunit AcrA (membrane-fusion protein)
LKVGQAARVRVTGVDEAFEGQVRLIGAVIEPTTRLGSVRIELREHRDLRPGAFARGEVETGRGSRPVIPQTAVMSDSNGNYVYLVGEGDQVERREVRIAGSRVEGLVVESGLQGGERLIETAGPYLRVGEKIRVAK